MGGGGGGEGEFPWVKAVRVVGRGQPCRLIKTQSSIGRTSSHLRNEGQ